MSTNDVVIDLEKHEVFSFGHCWLQGSRTDSHFPFRRSTASIGGSQAELSRNCAGVGYEEATALRWAEAVMFRLQFTQAPVAA